MLTEREGSKQKSGWYVYCNEDLICDRVGEDYSAEIRGGSCLLWRNMQIKRKTEDNVF